MGPIVDRGWISAEELDIEERILMTRMYIR
jgi:hypothetical protein